MHFSENASVDLDEARTKNEFLADPRTEAFYESCHNGT